MFYALAQKFGLSTVKLPTQVTTAGELRNKAKEDYKKHVENMKQVAEGLMGPEEKRSDYEE